MGWRTVKYSRVGSRWKPSESVLELVAIDCLARRARVGNSGWQDHALLNRITNRAPTSQRPREHSKPDFRTWVGVWVGR